MGCGVEGRGRARGRNGREKQQRQFSVAPPARCRLPLPPCLCLTLSSPSQSTLTSQSPAAPAGPSRSSLLGECALSAWSGGVASGVACGRSRGGGRETPLPATASRRRRRAVAGRLHGRLGTGGRGVRRAHLPLPPAGGGRGVQAPDCGSGMRAAARRGRPGRAIPPLTAYPLSLFFPTHSAEAKRSVELPVALTVAVGSALASPLAAQVSLAEQRCGEWRETGAPPRGRSAEEREERDPHPPLYPACGRPQIEAASSPSLTLQPLLAPLSLSLP